MYFWCICGEEGDLHLWLLCHLEGPPCNWTIIDQLKDDLDVACLWKIINRHFMKLIKYFENCFPSKEDLSGLPWWRSGWESACQCGGHGFEPWSGKIPHAAEQLGPCATTTEPAHLEPVLSNKRGRDSERPAHRDEEWLPLATTRGSPCTETKTQHSQK